MDDLGLGTPSTDCGRDKWSVVQLFIAGVGKRMYSRINQDGTPSSVAGELNKVILWKSFAGMNPTLKNVLF
jgi:hypothetical protein